MFVRFRGRNVADFDPGRVGAEIYGDHPALRHQPAQMFGDNRAAAGNQRFIRVEELLDGQLPRVKQKLIVLGLPAISVAIPMGLEADCFQQVGQVIDIDRASPRQKNRSILDLEIEAAILGDEEIGGQADGLLRIIDGRDLQQRHDAVRAPRFKIRPIVGLVEQMFFPVLNDQEFAIFDFRQGVIPGIACEPRFRFNERRGKFGVAASARDRDWAKLGLWQGVTSAPFASISRAVPERVHSPVIGDHCRSRGRASGNRTPRSFARDQSLCERQWPSRFAMALKIAVMAAERNASSPAFSIISLRAGRTSWSCGASIMSIPTDHWASRAHSIRLGSRQGTATPWKLIRGT